MEIYELREKINSLGNRMDFCIEDVFSWRGVYAEPACCISSCNTTKERNLEMLDRLTSEVFHGWKGGDFRYDEYSTIHFECERSSWSDGKFLDKFLLANANNKDVQYIFG